VTAVDPSQTPAAGATVRAPATTEAPAIACLDGNEAAARVAYALSEVVALYPITPASPMGERCAEWSAAGRPNAWGAVPEVVQMQSEAGAAAVLHGALQKGALATTFTASQGLLLMVPEMFKIAGELTPAVVHVAARAVATHALSIFGDHSDVMHARTTGWAVLCSGSVQEAHDLALVAHAATLRARVPFLHFFDGFRTSHEISTMTPLGGDTVRALVRPEDVAAFRARAMTPEAPTIRGTSQNPDVFFQAREAANPYHDAVPGIVARTLDDLAQRTGRRYGLVDYHGAPDADRVVVVMGSAAGAVEETVDTLVAAGQRVGLLRVRLFQPFPAAELVAALPPTVRSLAVLDRTKEPGAVGEPLYLAVVAALAEAMDAADPPFARAPRVLGVRYGLSSKEVAPSVLAPVFAELAAERPRRHATIGIDDDVTHLSLSPDPAFEVPRPGGEVQAVLFGLGSDGTVSAAKSTVGIIGENAGLHAQGYFVYDSKKAGSVTVSHLRFGPSPIRSTYLVDRADIVACHQFTLLDRLEVLTHARPGAMVLLNTRHSPEGLWGHLSGDAQRAILAKGLDVWVVDGATVAREVGLGGRISTVMQACFFALARVLPLEDALDHVRAAAVRTYGSRGPEVVARNLRAVDRALEGLRRAVIPDSPTAPAGAPPLVPADAPPFVRDVTARLLAGEGDLLPVSALPAGGVFPPGTAAYEKRALAEEIPVWDPDLCIDCGKCAIVCPHAAIRMSVFTPDSVADAPPEFLDKPFGSRELRGHRLTVQVAPDDCTGCGICVDVCPARGKADPAHKAIDLAPAAEHRAVERVRWEYVSRIPPVDRTLVAQDTVKGSQLLPPLFEFSGACSGCGETPYLKLATQLFGERMVVANATGCSSIYGGNLPTTPWTTTTEGLGPAWNNSLFEDNAEFGLGMRIAIDTQERQARHLLRDLAGAVGEDLVTAILGNAQRGEAQIRDQRRAVGRLRDVLSGVAAGGGPDAGPAARLLDLTGSLLRQSVWIIGGDGWAYDIGFGGLDHVLSTGRDVNVLVLDTEVYSNTGGQVSKATPRGAVARFAASGKSTAKKDLGAIARAYGNVYVAQVALGAGEMQTVRAFAEADAWPGPSLIIAYSTCIEHGIDLTTSMSHQKDAVRSGYWPLYRFRPSEVTEGRPFTLDYRAPSIPVADFIATEARFASLRRTDPERARRLAEQLQADADERWRYYEQLAAVRRTAPGREP
jgi:pyruvate-ferredoxin/flavodoxin oxidoreductase